MQKEAPTGARGDAVDRARDALRAIAARAQAVHVLHRVMALMAALLIALLVVGCVDYLLRLPGPIRLFNWTVGVLVLSLAIWRWIAPAARFRPSVTSVALRIEERRPDLKGILASGLELSELARRESESPLTRALARQVSTQTAGLWNAAYTHGVIRHKAALRSGAALALAIALIASVSALRPNLASIGVVRTVAPWAQAPWPKRTAVADVTAALVHPAGQALPLRAAVLRSNYQMSNTDVFVRYRMLDATGRALDTQRLLMTWQNRRTPVDAQQAMRTGLARQQTEGELFERLVETNAESIEYRFETDDDATAWQMVTIVEPPSIVDATARVEPPEYAAAVIAETSGALIAQPTTIRMGAGLDERAVSPPMLAGSIVSLTIALNKPAVFNPADPDWLRRTFGTEIENAGAIAEASEDGMHWTLHWRLGESVRVPVALIDGHGIESMDESVYRFQSVKDGPPSVTLLEPASDLSVLPTAVVELRAEARDDVGLRDVWITRTRYAPAGATEPSGPGGAVEATGEPVRIVGVEASGAATANASATLDLSVLGARAGEQVWIQALATDIFTGETGVDVRDPALSVVRRLLILTENEFIEEIRGELSGVRQAAMSIDGQQRTLRESAGEASDEQQRGQDQVTARIDREREQIDALVERVERNGLNDAALDSLLDAAQRALREAGARSTEAAESLDDAAQRAEEEAARDEEASRTLADDERERLDQAREGVQEQLLRLAEMLDRGEDAWVLKRKIQDLLEQQQQLRQDTARAGAETAGRTPEELTEDQRSELQRIVEKQQELAEDLRDTLDELQDGQERLEESDPTTAAGLAQAARRAREQNVEQQMEQAAQQAEQNQMSSAASRQQQAEEALEQMLEDIDQADQARDEVLRRLLLSLLSSLDNLIAQQETEIERLTAAREGGDLSGLDAAMVTLNRNTIGVLDMAKGGGAELGSVASLIGRASEAQTRAILALRAAPPNGENASIAEDESLQRLIEARDEADRLQQQVEENIREKKLNELRAAYRAALQLEIDLRRETAPFVGLDDLSRRQQAQVRGLGQTQATIREDLQQIRAEMEEIAEAAVFDYAHGRVEAAMREAGRALGDGQPDRAAVAEDRAIAMLQALLEAMEDAQRNDDDFRQAEGGGGGGSQSGGEQPLIPDLTQLRLLRQIQADLADRTRQMNEGGEPADASSVESLGQEQADLADLGEALIEKMQQQQGGAPPAGGGDPTERQ